MGQEGCFSGLVFDAPVFVSAMTTAGLVVLAIWIARHEDFFGRGHFMATVIAMIFWLGMATVELAAPTLPCKMVAAAATWPAIALAPISWSRFMWHYCFNLPSRWGRLETATVVLVAAITASALTNPMHGLFYGADTVLVTDDGRPYADFDHGPLFFVAAAVLYTFLSVGLGTTVVAAFRASRSLRPMMLMLMFATAAPMTSNIGYVFLDASLFGFDPTPFAFFFVLLVLTWAIYANRGFDLSTVALDLLYYNSFDPIVVVNNQGIVVRANRAAREILPDIAPAYALPATGPLHLVTEMAGARYAAPTQSEVSLAGRSFNLRILPIPRPLGEGGDQLGAVAILSDVTQLKRRNAQLAAALDRSRAQVAEITRLREIAERSAMSDPLTGLGNRRSMMDRVKALGDTPFVMALIDLDYFKQINDSYGHAVGDRVLRDFASMAQATLPPGGEAFRVGGEEFVLLLADKSVSEMLSVLASLKRINAERPSLRENDQRRVTFSAGVAARPGDGAGFDQLYTRADARLYQAKRSGRDRVMHIDSVSLEPASRHEDLGAVRGAGVE